MLLHLTLKWTELSICVLKLPQKTATLYYTGVRIRPGAHENGYIPRKLVLDLENLLRLANVHAAVTSYSFTVLNSLQLLSWRIYSLLI